MPRALCIFSMIFHFKKLAAFCIFLSLFLPLTQCETKYLSENSLKELDNSTAKIDNNSVKLTHHSSKPIILIDDFLENDAGEYLVLLTFVLPLLFCVSFNTNWKTSILIKGSQIILAGWLLYCAYAVVFWFGPLMKTLYGGYIFALGSLVFAVISIVEISYVKKNT